MKCARCDTEARAADQAFCIQCGARLQAPAPLETAASPAPRPGRPGTGRWNTLLGILVIGAWIGYTTYTKDRRIDIENSVSRAKNRRALGHYQEALDACDEALRRDPHHEGAALEKGLTCLDAKEWSQAAGVFSALGADHPDQYRYRLYLGRARRGMGDLDHAIESYLDASRLAPNEPVVHGELARAQAEQKAWKAAAGSYRTYLRLKPLDMSVQYDLGCVLVELGEKAEARGVVRTLDAYQCSELARQLESRLDKKGD